MLTVAIAYIGRRLLQVLLEKGHDVVCVVPDKNRLDIKKYKPEQVTVIEGDSMKPKTIMHLPKDIKVAYYLGSFYESELR